jgi:3'(2'), 5'-bisphosphate nucleotidase
VLGEENPIAYEIRKSWSCFWLVDPLDGTKDFIAKNDEFTINIALIKDGQPIIGLVGLPAKSLYYFASKGQGAFRISNEGEDLISNTRNKKELVCLDSRFHSSPETAAFCRNNSITQIEHFGSALKFCRLAEGVADIYPRLAPTREWDIAAGHCILQEANCQIIDLTTGCPPLYNKQSLLNNHFIALRDGLVIDLETLTLS